MHSPSVSTAGSTISPFEIEPGDHNYQAPQLNRRGKSIILAVGALATAGLAVGLGVGLSFRKNKDTLAPTMLADNTVACDAKTQSAVDWVEGLYRNNSTNILEHINQQRSDRGYPELQEGERNFFLGLFTLLVAK